MAVATSRRMRKFRKGINRTTISIPNPIKKRMDKFQDKKAVNWSAIATKAFKEYMNEHEDDDDEEE